MRGQRDTGWGLYFGPQRHETGPCHVLCVATHEGTNRFQPWKRGTAREGDGLASVGSLHGRNPSPPKPLKKPGNKKVEAVKRHSKKKERTENQQKPKKNKTQTCLFQSIIFAGEIFAAFSWDLGDGFPAPQNAEKENQGRNLSPKSGAHVSFGLDSNSTLNLYKNLVLLLNAENFFFKKRQTFPSKTILSGPFFLETFLFGGAWRFLESPKKLQASHVQLIQDEAGVWKAQLLDLCHVAGKKTWYTGRKSTNVPWKGTTYSCKKWKDCLPTIPSWGAMWVFFGEYHVKTHSRFLNKNHVKVTPPIFWRVILNWCFLSLFFCWRFVCFGSSRPCLLHRFRGVRPWVFWLTTVIRDSEESQSRERSKVFPVGKELSQKMAGLIVQCWKGLFSHWKGDLLLLRNQHMTITQYSLAS